MDLQIGVERRVRVFARGAQFEVHEQEGEVEKGVDACDRRIELDGVEGHRFALEQADIAEMEIAMAVPHRAVARAAVEQRGDALQRRGTGLIRDGGHARIEEIGHGRAFAPVLGDDGGEARSPAPSRLRRLRAVKTRHDPGQTAHQRQVEGSPRRQRVELRPRRKAAHLDDPVEGLVRADRGLGDQGERAAAPHDRGHAEIKRGRGPAIDREFGAAHLPSAPDGREIHVGKSDGALELVGALAGEEDHRAVGVDAARHGPAMQGRVGQEREDLVLRAARHGAACARCASISPAGSWWMMISACG